VGIRVVARNDKGEVVAAMAKGLTFLTDPAMAEALAAWEAIKFCLDRGWKNIILEGDARLVYCVGFEKHRSVLECLWPCDRRHKGAA
jgi:ribonuclease HI